MNGLLLIDKPKGMTSHDVVNQIRKLTKIKKVGHTGTLDPNASGLLVVCVGEATKLIPYLENSSKVYEAEINFGKQMTTDDVEGEIVAEKEIDNLNLDILNRILPKFIGEIEQIPPIYSAKKVKGKKLYEYARKNKEVEIKPSKVVVDDITILDDTNFPETVKALIKCSKGTYIRALARDIGNAMNNYGFLNELRRIETNNYSIQDSVPLDQLSNENILDYIKPLETIQENMKRVTIYPSSGKYLNNGNKLYQLDLKENLDEIKLNENVILVLNNKVKGIGKKVAKGKEVYIQPKKVLNLDSRE